MLTAILGIMPYETTPKILPVGTPAYVSKCISSLSQGKNNENEIHSLMKIEKKGKYDYNISCISWTSILKLSLHNKLQNFSAI